MRITGRPAGGGGGPAVGSQSAHPSGVGGSGKAPHLCMHGGSLLVVPTFPMKSSPDSSGICAKGQEGAGTGTGGWGGEGGRGLTNIFL